MRRNQLRIGALLILSLLGSLALIVYVQSTRAQGEDQLCVPQLGVDPAFPNPPSLDGVVEDWANPSPTPNPLEHDVGWNRAAKINLRTDLAGSFRTAKMLMGHTSADVWLALTVETAVNPDPNDTVVLMLSTDNIAANDWRIFVKPFRPGAGLNFKDDVPDLVTYARNSGTWNTAGNQPPNGTTASWLLVRSTTNPALPVTGSELSNSRLRVSRNGNIWSLEMRIPRIPASSITDPTNPGIFFPDSASTPSTFRMYVNVLSTDDLFGTFHDTPWPSLAQSRITGPLTTTGPTQLEFNTPAKDNGSTPIWGTASLFDRPTDCTGISLDVGDIGVEDPTSTSSPRPLISNIKAISTTSLPAPYPTPDGTTTHTNLEACLALPDGTFPSSLSAVNTFSARPTSTLPAPPNHLKVFFRIANFGIAAPPNYQPWHLISGEAGATSVTNPVECRNTATPCTFTSGVRNVTMPWQLSYKQSCVYSQANGAHQCIMADMESDDPNVRFRNKSVMRNMDFVSTSRFSGNAEISAVGYPAPPAGQTNQRFILKVDTALQSYRTVTRSSLAKSTAGQGFDNRYLPRIDTEQIRRLVPRYFPRGVSEVMVWSARGYRRTGNRLRIWEKEYEYAEPVGSFTYVAGHRGEIKEWTQTLTGAGLTRVADDVYTIEIPPGSVATVNTTIEAVEPQGTTGTFKHWGLSLHSGVSIPHGNFDTFYNPGPNFAVDLEYRINRTFSLEGIYGFHHLNGATLPTVSIGDLNLHQFSINGKVYGSSSPLRPFFNFGGGAYVFRPGVSTHGGLNIGVGVQRDITPNFAIEAMYNFHNVFTSGSSTRFSTVQGGVRFRF